jgi:hypothetical protein
MDKLNEYRKIVRELLSDFVQNDLNGQLIFDSDRDSPRRGFANDT